MVAKVFSTTGRRGDSAEEGFAPVVALVRIEETEAGAGLPGRLELGGRHPKAVTIGRHAENDAVASLPLVSKLHCQVTLRRFRLPEGSTYEAAFLHDVSKHGAFVNGAPVLRPWHWLQVGDAIGVKHQEPAAEPVVVDLFRVEYCTLERLPATALVPFEARRGRVPGAPRGRAAAATSAPPLPQFGAELVGRILDASYPADEGQPAATYRVRVVDYIHEQGWHVVDSAGLSDWDGESFSDELNLDAMFALGRIRFVDGGEGGGGGEDNVPLVPAATARRVATRQRAPLAEPNGKRQRPVRKSRRDVD